MDAPINCIKIKKTMYFTRLGKFYLVMNSTDANRKMAALVRHLLSRDKLYRCEN